MSRLFDQAVASSGAEYLGLEIELRRISQLGPTEVESLRQNLAHPDPVARLLAKVILDWSGSKGPDFRAALEYLEMIPVKMRPTAAGFPEPMGVEFYLTRHFDDRVVELMALRLAKESGWPRWKVGGIIFYLEAYKIPSTTSVLIRFSIETADAEWREHTLEAVREINDPELPAKLAFELARAKKMNHTVPPEVRALSHGTP